MSLSLSGGGGPKIPGAEALRRFVEFRFGRNENPGSSDGGGFGIQPGISRFSQTSAYGTCFRTLAGSAAPTLLRVNERPAVRLAVTLAAEAHLLFSPWFNGISGWPVDFRAAFGPVTGDVTAVPTFGWATSIMAWVRKDTALSATHARFTLGFCDVSTGSTVSGLQARCGLVGDGVLGFRFGSVNCPIGVAGENAANAIDANAVQPAELIDPAANWFHVRIKLIPATPFRSGRWVGYLNGRPAAEFASTANFPKGANITDHFYAAISAGIWSFNDTVALLPAYLFDDIRVWFEEDYNT